MGATDPGPPPARLIDMRGRIAGGHPAYQAVDSRPGWGLVAGRDHQSAARVGARPHGVTGQGAPRPRER
jgi:hypothetical protein